MIVAFPHSPLIRMAVTSPEGKSSCSHPSVSILSLIRMTDLVFCGSLSCVDGYSVFQSLLDIVLLNVFTDGSCNATMSTFLLVSLPLLIRSCWHARDLFIFCCQMVK